MNGNDLINAFGKIDDRFIEEAEYYNPSKIVASRKKRGFVLVAASLLTVLTIMLAVLLVGERENDNPSVNTDDLTHSTENRVNISDYQIKTEDYKIDNNVLLSYTGNESIVPIPNEVKVISSTAFGVNDNIKTIVLGANVEDIEPEAFVKLRYLKEFFVDKNNEYYQVVDGFLIKNDGTLVLADLGEYGDDRTSDDILYYVNNFIEKNKKHLDLFKKIEIGSAVLHICCEKDKESDSIRIYATALEVFGEIVSFDEKQYAINGNQKFQCFETEKYFVLKSNKNASPETDVYIFYDRGHILYSGYDGEYDYWGNKVGTYTASVITFYKEDNELYYHRIPEKFYKNVDQVVGIIMEKCVARDEFYKEIGKVDVIEGKLIFTPLKTYTIEQHIDIEKEYKLWTETVKGHIPDGLTLDEYLIWNSQRYERAK